jgi:uncharacterized phage protein gp47/JayE
MPRYVPKSHEQILSAMIAKVVARTDLSDVGDSSVLKHLLSAAARQDAQQYYQSSLLLQLFSIDTAAGEDLDERAKDIQPGTMRRLPAVKASGSVVFTRRGTTGTLTIPSGTKVKTTDGVVFSTIAVATITAASAEQVTGHGTGRDSNRVAVVADVGGVAGNVVAGTVTKFASKPAGVDAVVNLADFANGRDVETDDSFRARLKTYAASLARCNRTALENLLLGSTDPVSGATILFAKVVEDIVNRGNVTAYIDDGTGAVAATDVTAQALPGTWTWDTTTTVLATDTSTVVVGDFVRKDSSPSLWFQIDSITPDTSVALLNPGSASIPTGAGASSLAPENVTNGLGGPPANTAVGGEVTLWLNHPSIQDMDPLSIVSSTRGILVRNTDWIINPASGQVDFSPALSAGEKIVADYTYYVGLLAFAQKVIDGDPNDRINYPGYRAAGVYVRAASPQVLLQNVSVVVTVEDGYDQPSVKTLVRDAIKAYVNTLGIGADLVVSELVRRGKSVAGVYDLVVTTPAVNVVMLDDQLARTTNSNIVIA